MTRREGRTWAFMSVAVVLGAVLAGCEAPAGPTLRTTVPPPGRSARAPKAAPTYSYKHELRPDTARAERMAVLRREYVVAVARVGDTGAVDSPFGDRRSTAAVGEVNVSAAGAGGETAKVVVGVDDSLQSESIAPERAPAGFTQRARRQIISELQAAGCFTILERESINDIIRELEFGQTRWAAADGDAAEGALAKVRYIVKGGMEVDTRSVLDAVKPPTPDNWVGAASFPESSDDGAPYLFRLRMYSVRTGVIVAVADGRGGEPREAIRNAVAALTDLLVRNGGPVSP